jgi:DNA mismatch repair ATPase MutS
MSGKTTFLKQIAMLVIMGQVCFDADSVLPSEKTSLTQAFKDWFLCPGRLRFL